MDQFEMNTVNIFYEHLQGFEQTPELKLMWGDFVFA